MDAMNHKTKTTKMSPGDAFTNGGNGFVLITMVLEDKAEFVSLTNGGEMRTFSWSFHAMKDFLSWSRL